MILFVDQSGQIGGAELCLADLALHRRNDSRVLLFAEGPFADLLRGRGISVDILALSGALARTTKKSSWQTLAAGLPALAGHTLALHGAFRKAGLLYLNTAKALLQGTAANILLRRPCIFHLHDLWDERHFSATNIRLLVAAANRADAVITNSQSVADTFVSAGGRAPVHVIPNGFDPAAFANVSPAAIAGLRREGNPGGHPVVAIFGRLSRWKGQDVLIRAAALLPDVTVWIVGDALFTEDDRTYAAELRKMAESLDHRIRFLGFRSDVAALMAAADIIVHCSVSPEPFGRVLVEGMLAGKPVVAADAGGPKEIVDDGTTGLLVPAGDPQALAAAIGRLVASPDLREQMGREGRQRAERLFALPVILQKTDNVISSVLKKS
jgi:glycosyltransferase involved in cell wall biosynthesis